MWHHTLQIRGCMLLGSELQQWSYFKMEAFSSTNIYWKRYQLNLTRKWKWIINDLCFSRCFYSHRGNKTYTQAVVTGAECKTYKCHLEAGREGGSWELWQDPAESSWRKWRWGKRGSNLSCGDRQGTRGSLRRHAPQSSGHAGGDKQPPVSFVIFLKNSLWRRCRYIEENKNHPEFC